MSAADGAPLKLSEDFKIAVVGLRLRSEHEDDCWCTLELCSEKGESCKAVRRNRRLFAMPISNVFLKRSFAKTGSGQT